MHSGNYDEQNWISKAQQGNEDALGYLIERYMPRIHVLAASISHLYGLPQLYEDLVGDGIVGVWNAVSRFKAREGVPPWAYFKCFARYQMQQSCMRYLGLPDNARKVWGRVMTTRSDLFATLGYTPPADQIAAQSGVPLPMVERILRASATPLSLQQHLPDSRNEGDTTLEHLIMDSATPTPEDWQIAEDERIEQRQILAQRWNQLADEVYAALGADSTKWLLLYVLIMTSSLSWDSLATALTNPDAELADHWNHISTIGLCPPSCPRRWREIVALFPPPKLTGTNLKQWFSRRNRALLISWPTHLPQPGALSASRNHRE